MGKIWDTMLFYSIKILIGGPLYNGDIEDHNGKQYVMCPWHGYMFDLETGRNDIGLKVSFN